MRRQLEIQRCFRLHLAHRNLSRQIIELRLNDLLVVLLSGRGLSKSLRLGALHDLSLIDYLLLVPVDGGVVSQTLLGLRQCQVALVPALYLWFLDDDSRCAPVVPRTARVGVGEILFV